jgi:hypothetical protein
MSVDGFPGNEEPFSDFSVGEPQGNQLKHLGFGPGQAVPGSDFFDLRRGPGLFELHDDETVSRSVGEMQVGAEG